MRRWKTLLVWAVIVCLLAVGVGGGALAAGTKPSAGDNQYVDPLSNPTSPHKAKPRTTSTTPAATTPSTLSPTPPASVASTSSTAPTASHSAGKTLPYTGLNVGLCVAIGCAMLGAGVVLRRVSAAA